MKLGTSRLALAAAVFACASSLGDVARAQTRVRPERLAIRDVRLSLEDDAARFTLVLRDGRIEEILDADAATPRGARVIDGSGHFAAPAFLDAFSRTGHETPAPDVDQDKPVDTASDVRVEMRDANRRGIQPAFRAVDALALSPEDGEAWRTQGFGALLSAPTGQLLGGTSVLAATRDAAMRDLVVAPRVFAHAQFSASSASGGRGYPSTLMGYMAQLRQFFLDAQRHAELTRRYDAGRPGPRPAWDAELEAAQEILGGTRRVFCNARSSRDVERWLKLADEFGFEIGITNGRDAWRIADVLAERNVPVILTLDWGDEPDDPDAGGDEEGAAEPDEASTEEASAEAEPEISWEYHEPVGILREKRRLWEERRNCALVLHEAGVTFAFGTDQDKPKDLLKHVRELVEIGLPARVAMNALTIRAAELLGVDERLGAVQPGRDATFALWTGDPLSDDAQIAYLFVDGFPHEFEVEEERADGGAGPDEGVDVTGTWEVSMTGDDGETTTATVELTMEEDGTTTGDLSMPAPFGGETLEAMLEGRVDGSQLVLEGLVGVQDFEFSVTIELELDGDEASGDVTYSNEAMGEMTENATASRNPQRTEVVR